jgi:hypothetical protein
MKPRTGQPKDIAKVVRDKDARTWNTEMTTDDAHVTFAALDQDHAKELAELINACAWVTVRNGRADER